MCLVVVLHSLESGPHLGQRNALHRQETAIISQIASFHMQKAFIPNKCDFCMSSGEQALQSPAAKRVRSHTERQQSPPGNRQVQRPVVLLSPQESSHSTAGLGHICTRQCQQQAVKPYPHGQDLFYADRVHHYIYVHT